MTSVPDPGRPLDRSHPGRPGPLEDLGFRIRWVVTYGLLSVLGPPRLEGDADPRNRLRAERRARWEARARQRGA